MEPLRWFLVRRSPRTLSNSTPDDAYFGMKKSVLVRRENNKQETIK